MNGLAQQMAGAPAQEQAMQMPTVQEVAAMLAQGMDPEELVKAGVPKELIMEAISMLEQEMAMQQQQVPMGQPGDGLARMQAGGM